ncbi:MAG: sigma 54-interacting transcriptional regulator [Gemmatimonadetes bacterium]|nr:sigma 54-interacting transcriptional regulator [Gemmatimonadota bacterium]
MRDDTSEDLALLCRRVLGSITDGVLVTDLSRRIVFVNDQLASYYDLRADDLLGKNCTELIAFDHCKTCPHAQVSAGEAFTGHGLKCDRFTQGPFCVSASPLKDEDGRTVGVVEIFRDMKALGAYIEGMESTNRELEHERHRLNDMLHDSSDGWFTATPDRRILSADDQLLDILGRDRADSVGKSCAEMFGSDKCDTDCPIHWAVENGTSVINCREIIRAPDGPLPVDKSVFLHRDVDGNLEHVTGVIRNASELVELRRAARAAKSFRNIVSRDRSMERVFDLIRAFGPTDSTVLVLGESGTGKELVARAIVENSKRKDRPFVMINCSALAEGLLESELFGHVRGAFTGAVEDKRGKVAAADGGTLFLDEVGDMSPALQTKLLRVLEQQEFDRVGSSDPIRVDVRIVAATNRDLEQGIRDGWFRKDLYYRLNGIQIRIPPLRERAGDVPLLVHRFVRQLDEQHGRSGTSISARGLDLLQRHPWPGNVRELRNAVEFAYICSHGDRIERGDFPESIRTAGDTDGGSPDRSVRARNEREETVAAMERHGGHRESAARDLGISRTTLWRRLKRFGVE